jgi:hypothetical protein
LTSLSIQGWIYPRGQGGIFFLRGDDRAGLDPYQFELNDASHPGTVGFDLENSANQVVTLRAPVQLNQWQHVAGTFDGTTGDMRLYINGSLASQTTTTLTPLTTLDPAYNPGIGIGNVEGTFNDFNFNGYVDEISLYSRPLSQSEIQLIVNQVPEPGSAALVSLGLIGALLRLRVRRQSESRSSLG